MKLTKLLPIALLGLLLGLFTFALLPLLIAVWLYHWTPSTSEQCAAYLAHEYPAPPLDTDEWINEVERRIVER